MKKIIIPQDLSYSCKYGAYTALNFLNPGLQKLIIWLVN